MQGDSLAVFLTLAGFAGGAMLTAINAEGARARLSWAIFGLSGLATVAFWFRPSTVTAAQVWNYALALIPLVSVSLVLLARSPPAPKPPKVTPSLTLHSEIPSVSVKAALGSILTSEWSREHGAGPEECARELRDKLAAHKLTAWGRKSPSDVADPIPWKLWREMRIDGDTYDAVAMKDGTRLFSDLQFDRDYINGLWPQSSRII